MSNFVSRAGEKLQFALEQFGLSVVGLKAADFGSSTGGFVDCLLQAGVDKVYAVDTSYGELAWNIRKNPRVVVMERTNAMHVQLPEKVDLITIDTAWTKQEFSVPNALLNLERSGKIISLVKPHYEANKNYLEKGRLKDEYVDTVLKEVFQKIENMGVTVEKFVQSPIVGEKGKNREFLALLSFNTSQL